MHEDPDPLHPAPTHRAAPAAEDDKHSSLCSAPAPRTHSLAQPPPVHGHLSQPHLSQPQSHPLRWSTMSFSYSTNGRHSSGAIQMPSNFSLTPASPSDSPSAPFQPVQAPSPVPFSWSSVNEQLMHKLFRLEPYFRNKVVLELGAGFGIASMVSLHLGAKHVP